MLIVKLEQVKDKFYSTVKGKKLRPGELLSVRDKEFYACEKEFPSHTEIDKFIDYIMSAPVLKYAWNLEGGYNELEYTTKDSGKKILHGNHGMTKILRNMAIGKWDPTDVLDDMSISVKGFGFDLQVKYNKILEDLGSGSEFKFELTKGDYIKLL